MKRIKRILSGIALAMAACSASAAPAAPQTQDFHPPKFRASSPAMPARLKQAHTKAPAAKPAALTKAAANLPQINGVVIYADNWGTTAKTGLYQLPGNQSNDFQMMIPGPNGSSVVIGDRIYTINRVTMAMWGFDIDYPRYTVYDFESGEEIDFKNYSDNTDWSIFPIDMDVDPESGKVYAITFTPEMTGYQLSILNFTDTEVTSQYVAAMDGNWNAVAFDANGQLYGISKTNEKRGEDWTCVSSTLNKIDKLTGTVTPIGDNTGLCPEFLTSAAIDHQTNRMFWTVAPADNTGLLAEVDLATGKATVISQFAHSEEVVGLYVPQPEAAPQAPAKVKNLIPSFPDGSLSGKVTFTAPATLYDGTPASGSLSYKVEANGIVVATGQTSFGNRTEAAVTVPAPGNYKITATVSNAAGQSPTASVSAFIGNGVPRTPFPKLTYSDGRMTLEWDAVTESADGGFINPAQVTYTVSRFPGGITVSPSQSQTTFSENIPHPDTFTQYYYTVVANHAGIASQPATSNIVSLGEIVPPHEQTFDEESSVSGWTFIDANADKRRWMWSTLQNLRIAWHESNQMDDWAIMPAIRLEAGRAYQLAFDTWVDNSDYSERIEVKMGNANTAEAMTTTVVAPTDITRLAESPLHVTATITPAQSGVYYIGFHGISDPDQDVINLDNVTIGRGIDAGAPAAATDLAVTPSPTGGYSASISFKTPSETIAGGAIWQNLEKAEVWRDDQLVKTFTSPAPGTILDCDDNPGKAGSYTYTVYCYNMFGQGLPASATVFVGTPAPSKPATASIVETDTEGEVTVEWAAVTTDQNGNPVEASKITYVIAENNGNGWQPKFEGLTATTHTFQAVSDGQDLVQYAVFAKTEGGLGEGALTDMIPVGKPYPSLVESFAGKKLNTVWGTRNINNVTWQLFDDASGIASQDGDNGFMGMGGDEAGCSGALFSGKVSLAGVTNPAVSFYTFNIADDNINEIVIGIREKTTQDYTPLKTITVNKAAAPDQWGLVSVPLDAYAGKTVQVQFLCTINAYPYILLDNIAIGKPATGIGATDVASQCLITTDNGHIIVEAPAATRVLITTIDGKVLHQGHGNTRVAATPGIYVVKAGDAVAKTIVR